MQIYDNSTCNYKRMFRRTCEFPAEVYNIEYFRSALERPHSGGTTYAITVTPVPRMYA